MVIEHVISINWNNNCNENVISFIDTFKTFKSSDMKYLLMPLIRKFNSNRIQCGIFKYQNKFTIFLVYMQFNTREMDIQLPIRKFH